MKIAVFSDVHGHKYKDFDEITDRTGSKRLDNIVDTLLFIRDDCVTKGIKYALLAGDLYHIRGKVDTVVHNALYDTLKTFHEHGIEIIAIPGNHDQSDNSDVPSHSLHSFSDLPGVTVHSDLGTHYIDDEDGYEVMIHCVPYSKNAQRIKDWIENSVKGYEKPHWTNVDVKHICLFHLGIDGGFVGKGNYPMADAFKVEDLRPDFFNYVLGGHFHKHQFLGGHPHMLYTGAPIQHSFSDEGEEKGYFIIDTSKVADVQFVPIPNPRFISLFPIDIVGEDSLMKRLADEGHYVRIYVKEDELPMVLPYLPDNLKYKTILEKTYTQETRVDVKVGMSDEEVVTKYAEQYNLDALEVGLKILSEVKGDI